MQPKHIFLILLFILLSGCVSPNGNIAPVTGGIVKEFKATPSKAYSNEEVYVKMLLENDQNFFVKNIYVYLYNVGNDWGVIDVWGDKTHKVSNSYWSLDVDASFYISKDFKVGDSNVILNGEVNINDIENILKGKLPSLGLEDVNIFIMRDDISIMIYDLERFLGYAYKNNYERLSDVDFSRIYKTADKLPPIYIDYLYPPNEEHGKGEEVEVYWVIKPPQDIPKGKTISNEIKSRVCYEGVNRLTDAVHLISRNEFLYQNKRISKRTVSSTSGPVHITLEVNDPVLISDTNKVINMVLTIKNVGGGVVTSESCKDIMNIRNRKRDISEINKFNVKIRSDMDVLCDIQDQSFYLMANNEAKIPITCEVLHAENIPQEDKYFDVEVSYTYYKDYSTTFKVEGV